MGGGDIDEQEPQDGHSKTQPKVERQVQRGGTASGMRSKLASKPRSDIASATVHGQWEPARLCVCEVCHSGGGQGWEMAGRGHSDQGSEVTQHGLHSRSSRGPA